MAIISVNDLSFTYPGGIVPVFEGLDFHMDSSWRLGLVGRNGRGKTTLLKLLKGDLQGSGSIQSSLPFDYFPFEADSDRPAKEALIDALAPYTTWEREMEGCLREGGAEALARYGDIQERYALADGYVIREALEKEVSLLGFDPEVLSRPFGSFSPGEQTRLKLATLFLRQDHFLLIDEPTNHLDKQGRELMADYLQSKRGYLAVSHERDFLDRICDHILALEKQGARVVAGNYSTYRENKRMQDEYERAQRDKILGEVGRLRVSAREKAGWSDQVEASKVGQGMFDRGYVGHKSAKMMKRAKVIENRVSKQLEEKEKLLKNLEYTAPIKLNPLHHKSSVLLRFDKVAFGYEAGRPLFSDLSFVLKPGDRLALTGENGAGKSTLFQLILGRLQPTGGSVYTPRDLIISHLPQTARGLKGSPKELAAREGLDLTLFLTMLRKFDLPQELFERDITGFSLGQKKKTLLSLSLAQSAHLYLWDEPLNDIDIQSREQIEDMLQGTGATMIFIEHERVFVNTVATGEIQLS